MKIESTFHFKGLTYDVFGCSNYTFHENSIEGRTWEQSKCLCQKSSEGDLVSIEEENERIFVRNIIKNLTATKYFIGLERDQHTRKCVWKWLSNEALCDESKWQGNYPWAPGEPSANLNEKCATIYGNYQQKLGLFDDLPCGLLQTNAGYICERAVSCTKDEKGRSL